MDKIDMSRVLVDLEAKVEARIAELGAKTEELREATRAANESLKDIKSERKAVRELLDEIKAEGPKLVEEYLNEAVNTGLKRYSEHIQKAIDEASTAVFRRFDMIADALLGEDRKTRRAGRMSIAEMAAAIVEERNTNGRPHL